MADIVKPYPSFLLDLAIRFRDMGDGSFAEVLFCLGGGSTPPDDSPVNNGIMTSGSYILLDGSYLVLAS